MAFQGDMAKEIGQIFIDQGRTAFGAGCSVNPYLSNSNTHTLWRQGWEQARHEWAQEEAAREDWLNEQIMIEEAKQ